MSRLRGLVGVAAIATLLLAGCAGGPSASSCRFANDGECDDGRPGALSNVCEPGTDAADCANVDPTVCHFQNDGECDDGREGADSSICAPGTDDADCEGGEQ